MLQLFLGGFPLGELFSREAKRVFKPRTFCLPKDQDTLSREKSRLVEKRLYTQRTKKYKIQILSKMDGTLMVLIFAGTNFHESKKIVFRGY